MTKRKVCWVLLCVASSGLSAAAWAQDNTVTNGFWIRRVTCDRDAGEHRWPSVNSNGVVVWSQRDASGVWQIVRFNPTTGCFSDPCNPGCATIVAPSPGRNQERPAIADDGTIVFFRDGSGSGIGYEVVRREPAGSEAIVEFSSRNALTGAHRDAGKRLGLAGNGTSLTYFDFSEPLAGSSVRRFNVSGLGTLEGGLDTSSYDFPDINSFRDVVFAGPGPGQVSWARYESDAQTGLVGVIVENAFFPRVADADVSFGSLFPEIVFVRNGHAESLHWGTISRRSDGVTLDTANWVDVADRESLGGPEWHAVYEVPDDAGKSQVYMARVPTRGPGQRFEQSAEPWGPTCYAHHDCARDGGTIGHFGCALTAMGMAIDAAIREFPGLGGLYNPGTLNTYMLQPRSPALACFVGNNVGWANTVRAVNQDYRTTLAAHGCRQLRWAPDGTTWVGVAGGQTAATDHLRDLMLGVGGSASDRKGYPVIVGVKLRPDPGVDQTLWPYVLPPLVPGHYVLVTGIDEQGRFEIADPARKCKKAFLDEFFDPGVCANKPYYGGFEIMGQVIDPEPRRELTVTASNAMILITNASGLRTGYLPAEGKRVQEIPDSQELVYALDDLETGDSGGVSTAIDIAPAPGDVFTLHVFALNRTSPGVTISSSNADGSVNADVQIAVPYNTGDGSGQFLIAARDGAPNVTNPDGTPVENRAPKVVAGTEQVERLGTPVYLRDAKFTDPNPGDRHQATIDWGDGTPPAGAVIEGSGTILGVHLYSRAGSYAISVCVTDSAGSRACDGKRVTVLDGLAQSLSMAEGPSELSTVPAEHAPAGTLLVRASFTNQSTEPVHSLSFVVTRISGNNVVLLPGGGWGSEGTVIPVAQDAFGSDGALLSGETFTQTFLIGLASQSSFEFQVVAHVAIPATLGTLPTFPGMKAWTSGVPNTLAVADLNRDGLSDVVAVSALSSNMSVVLGAGAGAFETAKLIPMSGLGGALSVKIADLNHDHVPDLVTTGHAVGRLGLWYGVGDGNFRSGSQVPAAGFPQSSLPRDVAIGDLNGDAVPDLVTAHYGGAGSGKPDYVSVLLGNADGTYAAPAILSAGPAPWAVVLRDMNSDGLLDIVVLDAGVVVGGEVAVLLGRSDGTFAAALRFPTGYQLRVFTVADWNNDGALDVAVGADNAALLMLGRGDGTLGPPEVIGRGYPTVDLASIDYNGDGYKDLVISNPYASYNPQSDFDFMGHLLVLPGDGTGRFLTPVVAANSAGVGALAVFDSDLDGHADLAGAQRTGGRPGDPGVDGIVVYRGAADGTFPSNAHGLLNGGSAIAMEVADFDRNGQVDVAVATVQGSLGCGFGGCGIELWSVDGAGTLQRRRELSLSDPTDLAVADVNRDGRQDIVAAYSVWSRGTGAAVFLGNGDGTFAAGPSLSASSAIDITSVAAGDVDGDGREDVLLGGIYSSTMYLELFRGQADGSFAESVPTEVVGPRPWSQLTAEGLSLADFNADGVLDVALGWFDGTFTGGCSILIGNGDGTFAAPVQLDVDSRVLGVAVGDVNGDHIVDVLTTVSTETENVRVYLGHGDGTFASARAATTGRINRSIRLADLNGDRIPDVLAANQLQDGVSILLGLGDGSLGALQHFDAIDGAIAVAGADVNGDGTADLIAAGWAAVSISLGDAHRSGISRVGGEFSLAPLQVGSRDSIPPVSTAMIQPPSNQSGWSRGPVGLTVTAADNAGGVGVEAVHVRLAGAQSMDLVSPGSNVSLTVSAEGETQVTYFAHDLAGNVESPRNLIVRVDSTPPAVAFSSPSPLPNAAGWNREQVTIPFEVKDSGSGVEVVSPASGSVILAEEGTAVRGRVEALDRAGNQASVESPVVRIDLMAPRLTADAWVAGRRYEPGSWTAGPVTVSFRCEDLLSGVAYVSPQVVLSTEGRDQTITGECIDVAGNRTTVGLSGINVDRRPPTLECAATPTAMWPPDHRMVPIQIATRGTDALSGVTGIELLSVQSNEPDNGTGDGDTGGDIRDFVVGTFDIAGALRAERAGNRSGRIYTFRYGASDRAGNRGTCETRVLVSHDQSH